MGVISSAMHWRTWLVLLVIIFIVIWIMSSRNDEHYDFIGLKPLYANEYNTYTDDYNSTAKYDHRLVQNLGYNVLNDYTSRDHRHISIREIYDDDSIVSLRSDKLPRIEYIDSEDDQQVLDFTPPLPEHIQRLTDVLKEKRVKNISQFKPIKNGKNIKRSKGEQECHAAMERIFGVKFDGNVRPKWLRNPNNKRGRSLELDVYNEEIGIAVEYNGSYHYKYPDYYNKTLKGFMKRCENDNIKLDVCDEKGVYVITVPHNVRFDLTEEYIRHYIPPYFDKYMNKRIEM